MFRRQTAHTYMHTHCQVPSSLCLIITKTIHTLQPPWFPDPKPHRFANPTFQTSHRCRCPTSADAFEIPHTSPDPIPRPRTLTFPKPKPPDPDPGFPRPCIYTEHVGRFPALPPPPAPLHLRVTICPFQRIATTRRPTHTSLPPSLPPRPPQAKAKRTRQAAASLPTHPATQPARLQARRPPPCPPRPAGQTWRGRRERMPYAQPRRPHHHHHRQIIHAVISIVQQSTQAVVVEVVVVVVMEVVAVVHRPCVPCTTFTPRAVYYVHPHIWHTRGVVLPPHTQCMRYCHSTCSTCGTAALHVVHAVAEL